MIIIKALLLIPSYLITLMFRAHLSIFIRTMYYKIVVKRYQDLRTSIALYYKDKTTLILPITQSNPFRFVALRFITDDATINRSSLSKLTNLITLRFDGLITITFFL